VLFVITLIINMFSVYLINRFHKRKNL
ncbi:hypothetical protein, partial [Campylobacter jejuni]